MAEKKQEKSDELGEQELSGVVGGETSAPEATPGEIFTNLLDRAGLGYSALKNAAIFNKMNTHSQLQLMADLEKVNVGASYGNKMSAYQTEKQIGKILGPRLGKTYTNNGWS